MSFLQYIKDTRGELRHVAWPTQMQTVVYTVLVSAISAFVALYLGLFDYLFTSGVEMVLDVLPEQLPSPALDVSGGVLPSPEITIVEPGEGGAALTEEQAPETN